MTPNQAQELHDVIRESRLDTIEQRRLHAIVDADVTPPPRKGHGYIRLVSNGEPFETTIEAVDAHGSKVSLEIECIDVHIDCKRSELVMSSPSNIAMKAAGTAWQAVLTYPAMDLDIKRLGDALGPMRHDSIDDPPDDPPDTGVIDEPEQPDTTEEITKVEKPKGEQPRGRHEHTFVDGVCGWCGKRE